MKRYAEKNLYEGEYIVEKASRNKWGLVGAWIFGILCFWMLFVPTALAIKKTIIYTHTEIVLTNRRLICKQGVFHVRSKDIPLLKIQGVYVDAGFWGRFFNVGTIYIDSEYGTIRWKIHDADDFKTSVVGEMDQFERERLSSQSAWMANALADEINTSNAPRVARPRRRADTSSASAQTNDPWAGYVRRY